MISDTDPKSIFASKTFWLNILAPLFAWLGTKYGLQFDAETQAAVVGGVLGAVNVVLRAVTHQPVTVTGSASPAIAILFSSAAAAGLSACSGGQLTPQAAQVARIACAFDNIGEPVLTGIVNVALPGAAAGLSVAETLADPVVKAACAAIAGAPIAVAP